MKIKPFGILQILCLFALATMPHFAKAEQKCLDMHVIQSKPLGFYDKEGQAQGFEVEMLREMEKHSGICMNIHLMPIGRIWRSLELGLHDGGMMLKSPKHNDAVHYVSYLQTVDMIVLSKTGIELREYSDLYDLHIAKTRGTTISEKFDTDKQLNVAEVTNYKQVIEMFTRGRVDAIVGGKEPITYLLSKHYPQSYAAYLTQMLVVGGKEQWLQFSRKSKHQHLIPKLKDGVDKMLQTGAHAKLLKKHWGSIFNEAVATQ